MSDRVVMFDTTLRDGEQSPGATMNLQEKLRIARQLEVLGVDVIEAGFPISSEGDFEAVQSISRLVKNAQIVGLCRAVEKDIDRGWEALKDGANPRIHTFLATSPIHMQYKLRKTPDQVIEQIDHAVRHAVKYTSNVEFSAEDASRSDKDFLVRAFSTAIAAGATTINIPDTVGYAQPEEFGALVKYIIENTKGAEKVIFSVHCHDDLGQAVANTLIAIHNGARQAELALSGIGERAGNASLEEVAMSLNVRKDFYKVETNIKSEQIFPACRMLSMIIGRPIPANKAIIGGNAFAHESGVHQDGMLKNQSTYEIMTPKSIGRTKSDLVIGKHSGHNAVKTRLEDLGYQLTEEHVDIVYEKVKQLADKKAIVHDEDLESIVLSEVYRMPDSFRLVNLNVHSSTASMPATAAVEIQTPKGLVREAGFGAGPIDAAFNVITKLVDRPTELEQFSINAITGGTDAQGEVSVRLRDGNVYASGRGSDPDIIVASAKAFIDAHNRLAKKTNNTLV